MRYSLYVDRIFFLHFGMNFLLLWLTACIGNLRPDKKRLAASAAAGSLYFLAVLLILPGKPGFVPILKTGMLAVGAAAMLQLSFGFGEARGLCRAAGLYLAVSCALGGAVGAACGIYDRLAGTRSAGKNLFTVLFPSAAAAVLGAGLIRRERQREKDPLWTVRIRNGDREMTLTGLMDSGNGLYDPVSGAPVCILERAAAEKLGLLERAEGFRLIPYHSVGKLHGLLPAALTEELCLYRDGCRYRHRNVPVAVENGQLSGKKRYQMLLHPALLEEKKGENHDIESSDAGKDAV